MTGWCFIKESVVNEIIDRKLELFWKFFIYQSVEKYFGSVSSGDSCNQGIFVVFSAFFCGAGTIIVAKLILCIKYIKVHKSQIIFM